MPRDGSGWLGTLGIGWGRLGSVVTGGAGGRGRQGESVLIPGDCGVQWCVPDDMFIYQQDTVSEY